MCYWCTVQRFYPYIRYVRVFAVAILSVTHHCSEFISSECTTSVFSLDSASDPPKNRYSVLEFIAALREAKEIQKTG